MTIIDYTTTAAVLQAIKSQIAENINPDAALIGGLVTAVSRDVDHYLTGVPYGNNSPDGYLQLQDVASERCFGRIDNHGKLHIWPHKPVITAVSAISYQWQPRDTPTTVDLLDVLLRGGKVEAFLQQLAVPGSSWRGPAQAPAEVQVTISYTGGLSATVANLPADLQLAVRDLVIRTYREERAGIADAIGVGDLGVMTYTKQMPVRIARQLQPYKRLVGWDFVA